MRKPTLTYARSLVVALLGAGALTVSSCGADNGGQTNTGTGGAIGTGGSMGTGGNSGTGTGGDSGGTGGNVGTGGAGTGGTPAPDGGPGDAPPDIGGNPDGGGGVNPTVVMNMRKVADWFIARNWDKGWQSGAGWTGLSATYQVTKDQKYLDAIIKWAGNWALNGGAGARGDNQCAAQAMFEAYMAEPIPANMVRLTPKSSFDQLVANTPQGRAEWWWEDALFMVPPGFARLGAITGNKQYFATMNTMFWDTYAFLWNAQNGLMYRDHRGQDRTFWARGNGWVMAGTARVLQYLPMDDPRRPNFVKLLQDMAGSLRTKQGMDGCWRSDLLNANAFPQPESSGTGFFTFGTAWGVNNGILDKAMYQPVAQKGWDCLVKNVAADGRLGYVQGTGVGPNSSNAGSTPEAFGPGAFLLAGSEVAKF